MWNGSCGKKNGFFDDLFFLGGQSQSGWVGEAFGDVEPKDGVAPNNINEQAQKWMMGITQPQI